MSTELTACALRRRLPGAALLAVLLLASRAHAQAPEPPDTEQPAPDSNEARAAALFAESADHYRAGRFERAIALLLEAHRLAGAPVLLYNLGRAYEGHGDLERAIAAYRRYLSESTEVKDRGAIEGRIATLEAQLAERARLEQEAEAARKRAAEAATGKDREAPSASPVPWIIAGVGGATAIAGAVLGGLAASRASDAEDEPQQVPAAALRDEAETLATAANITLAVGGAILLGGVAWGIADVALLPPTPAASLWLHIGPAHAGLRLSY